MKCLNCHQRERNGHIAHTPTCPSWKGANPGQARADATGRYDLLVSKLTPARRRDRYECPSCGDHKQGLNVDPGSDGPLFHCFGCCRGLKGAELRQVQTEILAAVGLSWSDIRPPAEPNAARKPSRYFAKGAGLKAATLADDIIDLGPLAEGADDIMWRYRDGVWRPDKTVVRTRAAGLLDNLYRPFYARAAEDVIRARVRRIHADPVSEYINFPNGLLDWRTGQLHAHTADVLSTVQLAVPWDPAAECPEFSEFLTGVVPADMVEVVWELIGYLMFSGNPLHKAVMLVGTGRNGKGTLLRVIVALLGGANVTAVSLHDLVSTRFATVSLFGKLANIAGDIDGGYLESTATFKAVTGQDQISAEHKGRDRFDFTPWAVPVFSANQIPASADATIGYLSRWLVVPFPHDFTGREDRRLDARLHDPGELAGIAARAVPALRRLLERGDFELPASGKAAYEEFTRRVDQVRTWLSECCVLGGDDFTNRVALYRAFKDWAARDGHRPVKAGTFYDRLNAAGCEPTKLRGENGYRGLRVVDSAAPGSAASPRFDVPHIFPTGDQGKRREWGRWGRYSYPPSRARG